LFLIFYTSSAGYRFNSSPSVPVGIWKIERIAGGTKKGDYVAVPPEAQPKYSFALERGYLTDGMFLLKKITAASGDIINYDAETESVTVNGENLPHSTIFSADSAGRPLWGATFPRLLKKGEIWLSSENTLGYDSRYFGPVSADLVFEANLVFTF
jgi:conjugative transfer signal peptidase TraF